MKANARMNDKKDKDSVRVIALKAFKKQYRTGWSLRWSTCTKGNKLIGICNTNDKSLHVARYAKPRQRAARAIRYGKEAMYGNASFNANSKLGSGCGNR
jgi:hypothetical protein